MSSSEDREADPPSRDVEEDNGSTTPCPASPSTSTTPGREGRAQTYFGDHASWLVGEAGKSNCNSWARGAAKKGDNGGDDDGGREAVDPT